MREGALEKIRLLALKLVQGVGGNYINADGMNAKLDNVTRRWDHLQSLAVERYNVYNIACDDSMCCGDPLPFIVVISSLL